MYIEDNLLLIGMLLVRIVIYMLLFLVTFFLERWKTEGQIDHKSIRAYQQLCLETKSQILIRKQEKLSQRLTSNTI